MNFKQALECMKAGHKVKRPHWSGFWAWELGTVMMHTKEGDILDIFSTDRPEYTLDNIASDDFIIADEGNTAVLGGELLMDFGCAVRELKKGRKVARKGWNGKGMFLFLGETAELHTKADLSAIAHLEGDLTLPSIVMKTAEDKLCVGWLASQTDMLSEDWVIVE